MATTNQISGGMIRIDTSRLSQYLGPDTPKLSFGQKVGRFLGKTVSFLGPIGAAVTAVAVPGVGLPIAAGLYGVSNVSGSLTANAQAKDINQMTQAYKEAAQFPIITPGLFEQATQAQVTTDFIVPQELEPKIGTTIINRELSQSQAIKNF